MIGIRSIIKSYPVQPFLKTLNYCLDIILCQNISLRNLISKLFRRYLLKLNYKENNYSGYNEMESPPKIGQEIQRLRLELNFTLDQLAAKSGVSKSILSQIERDHSNPTLATIWRITKALESPLENVLSANDSTYRFEKLSRNATPEVSSEDNRFRLRILGTLKTVSSVQWYEFNAEPGAELISESHGKGSLESITLCTGNLTVTVGDDIKTICAGETLRYHTDLPHKLKNEGNEDSHGFMVNLL